MLETDVRRNKFTTIFFVIPKKYFPDKCDPNAPYCKRVVNIFYSTSQ